MVVLLVLLPHSNKVLVSNPPGGFFCVEMHVFPVPVTQVSIAETTVVHSVCRAFPNSFLHLQKYIHKKNENMRTSGHTVVNVAFQYVLVFSSR